LFFLGVSTLVWSAEGVSCHPRWCDNRCRGGSLAAGCEAYRQCHAHSGGTQRGALSIQVPLSSLLKREFSLSLRGQEKRESSLCLWEGSRVCGGTDEVNTNHGNWGFFSLEYAQYYTHFKRTHVDHMLSCVRPPTVYFDWQFFFQTSTDNINQFFSSPYQCRPSISTNFGLIGIMSTVNITVFSVGGWWRPSISNVTYGPVDQNVFTVPTTLVEISKRSKYPLILNTVYFELLFTVKYIYNPPTAIFNQPHFLTKFKGLFSKLKCAKQSPSFILGIFPSILFDNYCKIPYVQTVLYEIGSQFRQRLATDYRFLLEKRQSCQAWLAFRRFHTAIGWLHPIHRGRRGRSVSGTV